MMTDGAVENGIAAAASTDELRGPFLTRGKL
jgi:hypothetical protein